MTGSMTKLETAMKPAKADKMDMSSVITSAQEIWKTLDELQATNPEKYQVQ